MDLAWEVRENYLNRLVNPTTNLSNNGIPTPEEAANAAASVLRQKLIEDLKKNGSAKVYVGCDLSYEVKNIIREQFEAKGWEVDFDFFVIVRKKIVALD